MVRLLIILLGFQVVFGKPLTEEEKNQTMQQLQKLINDKISTQNVIIKIDGWPHDVSTFDLSKSLKELEITPDQRRFTVIFCEKQKISGRIEWQTAIPVLIRPIGSQDIISKEDIILQNFPTDQLNENVIIDINHLVGKSAKIGILRPGLPLDHNKIKTPTLIKKGDLVDITLRSYNLVITVQAIAKADGATGEQIPFIIPNNVKVFYAKTCGIKQAEIYHEKI